MPEWKIEEPPNIRKIFKRLGSEERKQYQSAIRTLATSDNPRVHGQYKKMLGCYSYRLTDSFRISYDIDFSEHKIDILGIGDHKRIYGRDKHS